MQITNNVWIGDEPSKVDFSVPCGYVHSPPPYHIQGLLGQGWVLAQEQPGTDHHFLFPHPASTMQTGPGPQRFAHRLCSWFAMQMAVWAGRRSPRRPGSS